MSQGSEPRNHDPPPPSRLPWLHRLVHAFRPIVAPEHGRRQVRRAVGGREANRGWEHPTTDYFELAGSGGLALLLALPEEPALADGAGLGPGADWRMSSSPSTVIFQTPPSS